MDNHPIPQDVSHFQFKLVGDLTVKQLGYLGGGCVAAYIAYALPGFILFKLPFMLAFAGTGAFLTFVPIDGRPADVMLRYFFKALFVPNQYVFRKNNDNQFLQHLTDHMIKVHPPSLAAAKSEFTAKTIAPVVTSAPVVLGEPVGEQPIVLSAPSFPSTTQTDVPPAAATIGQNPPPLTQQPVATSPLQPVQNQPAQLSNTVATPSTPTIAPSVPQSVPPTPQQAIPQPSLQQAPPSINPPQVIPAIPTIQSSPTIPPVPPQIIPPTMPTPIIAVQNPQVTVPPTPQPIQVQPITQVIQPQQPTQTPQVAAQPASIVQPTALQTNIPVPPPQNPPQQPVTPPASPQNISEPTTPSSPQKTMAPQQYVPDVPNIIVGTVKDPRGNILSNILIEVKDNEGNPVRAFKTNQLGQFASATPLLNGSYTLIFEDPANKQKFDTVEIVAEGKILMPINIVSVDQREELRKQLFG